ncbi:hypothetical protein PITC_058160 [Penicillium italicum]|uniref:Uncharacterized protein n=1 Tax=Penicillium italicum TaxID=40296 RepID=A0A0A2L7K5_PENIT|nr:hypothetical protein PITC_058160 [Penicillium italicum]
MSGWAETRTPEPPDRDEHEKSPPRPVAQREAVTSDDASTESDDTNAANLVKELVKLRRDIKRRADSHREEMQKMQEELQKVKEEFSTALAENGHDEILREIQSSREEISTPAPASSPSYADVARTPPPIHPSNIRNLSTSNTTPTTFTDTLYCTIDTSKMAESESEKASAGSIRATIETEIRKLGDHTHWRCRAVTVSPRDTNRIRIACRNEAEHQLVKKLAEANIGAGARVLRDELYPIKVDSMRGMKF